MQDHRQRNGCLRCQGEVWAAERKLVDQIAGGSGADTLYGGAGNDTIMAGSGADLVYGGSGDDVIYLGLNDGAQDVYCTVNGNGSDGIYGFEIGTDLLDLRASGFASFAELESLIGSDASGNATIDLGDDDVLTLFGIGRAELDQSAFQF